jgi:queuine/archaeosine tRNA-ribosyltransferase
VNIYELAVSPGLAVLAAAGGLAAFCGWRERIVALKLSADDRPERAGAIGWRGRGLPVVVREEGDALTLLSPLDGSKHQFSVAALESAARDLGAETVVDLAGEGIEVTWWRSCTEAIPGRAWVASSVPADAAADGRYWDGAAWSDINSAGDAATAGALMAGCGCRTCQVAPIGYLGHLWRQREITAAHLLGWHNLYQARLLTEGS